LSLVVFSVVVAGAAEDSGTPSKSSALRRGDALVRSGSYEAALNIWRELERRHPDDTEVLLRIGVAESMLENHDESEAAFLRAMELDPNDATVIYNYALSRLRVGDDTSAEEYLKTTLEVFPSYPEANYHLGLIAERRGDKKAAEELYVKEMNENPNMPRAWAGFFRLRNQDRSRDERSDRWMLNFAAICAALSLLIVTLARKPRIRRHEPN